MKTAEKVKKALEIKFDCDLSDGITIKEYILRLVIELFYQKEGFSGKRPFGDSGWEYDLYKPLIEHGLVSGVIDVDGCVDTVDSEEADQLLFRIIYTIFNKVVEE